MGQKHCVGSFLITPATSKTLPRLDKVDRALIFGLPLSVDNFIFRLINLHK
jgi:hypothetical protein